MRPRFSKTRRRLLPRVIALTCLASGIAAPAAASDSKYFNGAFCRVAFAFNGSNMADVVDYSTNGSVANRSTNQPMTLVCPIVRDNTSNTDGWDSIEVGYFDKHSGDAISCTAFSRTFSGGMGWDQGGLSVDTLGSSWAKTNMIFNDGSGFSSNGGFYFIRCILPPLQGGGADPSAIAYYRIQEP